MSSAAIILGSVLALVMQRPAALPKPPARPASLSGAVVRNGTGEPLANVWVTVARIDAVPPSTAEFLRQMSGRGEGGPPIDSTFPGEFFERMKTDMAGFQGTGPGVPRPEELPPEFAMLRSLPVETFHSVLLDSFGRVGIVSKNAPPVLTDGGGRFSFQNLEPGTYRLVFASNGFVRQDYGQRAAGSSGIPIVLASGQALDGVVMPMIPTGAVSGRITDSKGQPLAAVSVKLARLAYDATAKRRTQIIAATQTDDRGEYRFYYVTPGRYFVSAGGGSFYGPGGEFLPLDLSVYNDDVSFGLLGSNGPNRVIRNHVESFYPGGADVSAATPVEIAPGSDIERIDISVADQRYYTIRGSVVDAASGRAPAAVSLVVANEDSPNGSYGDNQEYNPQDGTFEIRHVPPGTYLVLAQAEVSNMEVPVLDEQALRAMTGAERNKYYEAMAQASMIVTVLRALATITVGNADVEAAPMRISRGGSVAGRLRVEPGGPARAIQPGNLLVQLKDARHFFDGTPDEPLRPDGSFRIANLVPGEYRASVDGLPSGFYLKSATYGGSDVVERPVVLPSEKPGQLEITIGFGLGQLDGVVTGSTGRPEPGSLAVLIPERNRSRLDLFRSVTAGGDGRFSLANVVPGDYRLVAWEVLEPYGYFDPAFLAQAAEKGKVVRVGESSRQTVNIQTLPLPGE